MKHLSYFDGFLVESINQDEMLDAFNDADVLESIVTDSNELLTSIKAVEVDLYTTFGVKPGDYRKGLTVEQLFDDDGFNNRLRKMKLDKTFVEYSDDSETFLDKSVMVKFFTVHVSGKSQLDRQEYIIFQCKKGDEDGWDDIKCYKVNDDMRKFYDKLSNKTIELKDGDKSYIYSTSNCAEWTLLKNGDGQGNKTYRDTISSLDIKAILKDKNVTITILK